MVYEQCDGNQPILQIDFLLVYGRVQMLVCMISDGRLLIECHIEMKVKHFTYANEMFIQVMVFNLSVWFCQNEEFHPQNKCCQLGNMTLNKDVNREQR